MSKKPKDKEVDFFDKYEKNFSSKQKKKIKKSEYRKNKSNKSTNKEGLSDNEIIIGVNSKPIDTQNVKKNNNRRKQNNSKKKDKQNKKRKLILFFIKIITIIVLICIAIGYLVTSPIFNIKKIEVSGSEKITTDTYISLSGITIGKNIYDLNKRTIKDNIKQEPYVDTVQVKRKLPDTIEITIEERKESFIIPVLNSYAYINNQGYFLQISENKIDKTIITGYTTPAEKIIAGDRLNEDDLLRLETVLKIMDVITISGITEKVNEINISDKNNYTLIFYEEGKIAYLGDASNLTDRISIFLKAILQKEKGKSGEIFINGDLNQEKVFFREKV